MYHTVVFFGREVEEVVVEGVNIFAFIFDLVVKVRPCTFACVADRANYFGTSEFLPFFYFEFVHVGIKSFVFEPVIDYDGIAISLFPTYEFYDSVASGIYVGASRSGEVHTLMEFASTIYGVDAISKTRSDASEVFV